jgi:DNA-binding transcriptional ArsR family regulator
MKRADLILHPVRLRIIVAFASAAGSRQLTVQQLADLLPDLPQASLYRHVDRLYRSGALVVADERQVRGGAVERTYVLAAGGASLSQEDLANATREEHLGYFTTFAAGLIAQFERYLQRTEIDLAADGSGYRQIVLNLSDEELQEMAGAVNMALARFIDLRAEPGRRRRLLATVLIPLDTG